MRPCLDCGTLSLKSRCPLCESHRRRQRKAEGKTGARGSTHAWRLIRVDVLERDNYVCQSCFLGQGEVGADGQPVRLEVDHIDGDVNNNAMENLVAMCGPCHRRKHGANRSRIARSYVD